MAEGSTLTNLVVATGSGFPELASEGEMFYRNDGVNEGMYVYDGEKWMSLGTFLSELTGDVTGTIEGGTTSAVYLATIGTSGTFAVVTVDEKGRVISGTSTQAWSSITSTPTTLSGYGITDSQPLDPDLTAIASITATSGLLKKTGASTWTLDTSTYLTGNESIALSGDATGSGSTSISVTLNTVPISKGGTGATTTDTAINNLLPLQTSNQGKFLKTDGTNVSWAGITTSTVYVGTSTDDVTPIGGTAFYADGNGDSAEGLYIYSSGNWVQVTGAGSIPSGLFSADIEGDVSGTIVAGDTSTLTLVDSGISAGSYGSASTVAVVTVDAKGRMTSATSTSIAIAASQITSGALSDGLVTASNVTQHQAALTISETQITDGSLLARVGSSETISGTWTFNSPVTVGTPTVGGHAATKDYVDNAITGLDMKASVRVATTANITLSGTQTIDGVAVTDGDRVLVKDQNTASENGIYLVAAGSWTRTSDADNTPSGEVTSGMYTFVEEGTTNADSGWVLSTNNPITLGSTNLSFVQFNGLGQITAGSGLTKTGNTMNVVSASADRVVVNADSIDLATTGTAGTYTKVTTDAYGRIISGTTISAGDIPSLADTYVLKAGDTLTGTLTGTNFYAAGGTTSSPSISFSADNNTGIYNPAADTIAFVEGGIERMRIDSSGNVGIGTSTPEYALHVNRAASAYIMLENTAALRQLAFGATSGSGNAIYSRTPDGGNSPLSIFIGAEQRVVITSSGSNGIVGVNISPNSWSGTGTSAIQIGPAASGFLFNDSNNTNLGSNAYWDNPNWRYQTGAVGASRYLQTSGAHIWETAAAGTADNVISFTRAMTLDTSGDVVIGDSITNSIRLTAAKNNPTRGILAHIYNLGSSAQTGAQVQFTQNNVANWAIGQPAGANAFAFWAGRNTSADGTEVMRIDSSGNVGIGTSSPIGKLDIRGPGMVIANLKGGTGINAGGAYYITKAGTSETLTAYGDAAAISGGTPDQKAQIWTAGGIPLSFAVGSTEKMIIDSSGNVGLGVTPSAWSAFSAVLQQRGGGHVVGDIGAFMQVGANNYYNGSNWIYTTTAPASRFTQNNGIFQFFTAPSGTAGNAITFTQAMTLDASGNLGIGTSSPAQKLEVIGTGRFNSMEIGANNSDINNVNLNAIAFKIQGTERMRLDTSGNLGLGVVPSASSLQTFQSAFGIFIGNNEAHTTKNAYYNEGWKYATSAAAARFAVGEGDSFRWYTAPSGTASNAISFTQAMVLDVGGQLGLGVTSPTNRLTIGSGSFSSASVTTSGLYTDASLGLVALTDGLYVATRGGAGRFQLDSSGNLGLGASPNTWSAGTAFQFGPSARGFLFNDSNNTNLGSNAYYDGSWKYQTSSVGASRYAQTSGGHIWYNAPSGTAGNAITFTQAMTLDSSGNLIVGGTSALVSAAGRGNITINGTSTAILNLGIGGISKGYIYHDDSFMEVWNADNSPLRFGTNNAERVRIDSSGNVGIGTTSFATSSRLAVQTTSGKFDVRAYGGVSVLLNSSGAMGYNVSTGNGHIWQINDSDVARIDASGHLLVGTTSSSWAATAKAITVKSSASGIEGSFANSGATNATSLVSNAYYNSGWKYVYSGGSYQATRYDMEAGVHSWHTAAAGTAGTTATFTQAMTLDTSGTLHLSTGPAVQYTPAPAALSSTATLSNANIQAQIISATGATPYTLTMPLGTTLETLATWQAVNTGYDFYVINTASGTVTMATNTNVTSLGALAVTAGTSAHFRIRRTAANTFVLYRLS